MKAVSEMSGAELLQAYDDQDYLQYATTSEAKKVYGWIRAELIRRLNWTQPAKPVQEIAREIIKTLRPHDPGSWDANMLYVLNAIARLSAQPPAAQDGETVLYLVGEQTEILGKQGLAWATWQVLGALFGITGLERIRNWYWNVSQGEPATLAKLFPITKEEMEYVRVLPSAPPAGEQWVEEAAKEIAREYGHNAVVEDNVTEIVAIIRRHRGEK